MQNHTNFFIEIYFRNILRELMIMVLKVKPILIIFTRAIYLKKKFFEWQQNSFFNVQNKNENNLMSLSLNEIDVPDVDFEKLNEIKEKQDKMTEIDSTVKEKIKNRKNDEKKKQKRKEKKTKTQRTVN